MGLIGERGVRLFFTADAVKVGPRQRPKLNDLYSEVLETLDWPERPDLFVSQTLIANAMAVRYHGGNASGPAPDSLAPPLASS